MKIKLKIRINQSKMEETSFTEGNKDQEVR